MKRIIFGKILPALFFLLVAVLQIFDLIYFASAFEEITVNKIFFILLLLQKFLALLFNLTIVIFYFLRTPFQTQAKGFSERYFPVLIVVIAYLFNLWVGFTDPSGEVLIVLGICLAILGYLLSILSLFYLGRSFGIMAEVRSLVKNGPYALIRHPLYLGEAIFILGMIFVRLDWVKLIVFGFLFGLVIVRARNEELKLKKSILAYSEYQKKTGFFWPKFGGKSEDFGG